MAHPLQAAHLGPDDGSSHVDRRIRPAIRDEQRAKIPDREIREILELADREDRPRVQSLPSSEGLTASELVEVGREVGLAPDRITRAVAEYEARGVTVRGGSGFGAPPRIGRTVGLQRAPTDQEWEVLVSELRSTFDAKGEVTSRGDVREWSPGNLQAFIEPTGGGYRLRMTDSMPRSGRRRAWRVLPRLCAADPDQGGTTGV